MSNLLEIAKQTYTPGKFFLSPVTNRVFEVGQNPVFEIYPGLNNQIQVRISANGDGAKMLGDERDGFNSFPFVYSDGVWAEVYKNEPVKENVKEMKKTQKISREAVRKIYPNVCDAWQHIIEDKLKLNMFNDEIEVEEELIAKGLSESNSAQRELILKYFKEPEKPKLVEGYFVSDDSNIHLALPEEPSDANRNVFATEKQAKSALAAAQ